MSGGAPRTTITAKDLDRLTPWIDRLSPRLCGWLRLHAGGVRGMDPDDFVQEVWCRVVLKLAEDHRSEPPADGWVFQVAKFVLLESLRHAKTLGRVRLPEGSSTIVRAIEDVPAELTTMTRRASRREDVEKFLARVEELDPIDREVLRLCGLEERPHAEVAAALGMQRSAVSKRWTRLRERIRAWNPPAGLVAEDLSSGAR